MAQTIEEVQKIIDDNQPSNPNADAKILARAIKSMERLTSIGSAKVQIAAATPTENLDPQIGALIQALNAAASNGGGGAINPKAIREAVIKELALRKIGSKDLSDELLGMLNAIRNVSLVVSQNGKTVQVGGVDADLLAAPLTQRILSDVEAKNNVYLYGGAGTGKTYISKAIAKMLDWEAITINCNQYTSPLDILGGQTIDGYQEGKLSIAWKNEIVNPDKSVTKFKGVVLILDELPKIDPNTAGILNDALANIKDFKKDKDGNIIPPTIRNGRNELMVLGNLFVIATGNVALNTIDPDYEANFKQDLSLQDRFIGSTYKVFVNYRNEANVIMRGFAFIWLFGIKLRNAISDAKATSQAFVSIRLMENMRETYKVYRSTLMRNKNLPAGAAAISNPKNIIESVETVLTLIKPSQRQVIEAAVDFAGFKRIVQEKDNMPFDPMMPNFDTDEELKEVKRVVDDYERMQKNNI